MFALFVIVFGTSFQFGYDSTVMYFTKKVRIITMYMYISKAHSDHYMDTQNRIVASLYIKVTPTFTHTHTHTHIAPHYITR